MENAFKGQISGTFVLRDLMDKICQYLDIKDLCSISQVCKAWHYAVKRELQYRNPQRLWVYQDYKIWVFEGFIKIKPSAVLLFIQHYDVPSVSREQQVCLQYRPEFCNVLIGLGAEKVHTDKNITYTPKWDSEKSFVLLNYYEIPGLVLPHHNTLKVNVTIYTREELKSLTTQDVINNLIPHTHEFKTVLMLFTHGCNISFMRSLMKSVKRSFQKDSFTLWGGELYSYPCTYNGEGAQPNSKGTAFVGLSITSPNVECYSMVLDCDDINTKAACAQFFKFRDSIKLRQNSIGFINAPAFGDYFLDKSDQELSKQTSLSNDDFYKENYEKKFTYCIRRIFPRITFISTFRDNAFRVFGFNSTESADQHFIHENSLSLLIITFS